MSEAKDTYTREEARALVAQGVRAVRGLDGAHDVPSDIDIAARLVPDPPSPFTYGREIVRSDGVRYRRRSDGRWECCLLGGGGFGGLSSWDDVILRALAAEVPLADAECHHIGRAIYKYDGDYPSDRNDLRAAVARVLRGEVKP